MNSYRSESNVKRKSTSGEPDVLFPRKLLLSLYQPVFIGTPETLGTRY
jgi:hypothetical protein